MTARQLRDSLTGPGLRPRAECCAECSSCHAPLTQELAVPGAALVRVVAEFDLHG